MSESAVSTRRKPPGAPGDRRDDVEIRLPADSAYLSVLRTTVAGLAARLDFTVTEIEDLRIAVDEACSLLLLQADAGAAMTCAIALEVDALRVRVAVPSSSGALPQRDSFGWTVLAALAGDVDAGADDGSLWMTMRKRRSEGPPA